MKRLFNILLISFLLLASLLVIMRMQACTLVRVYQRDKLANPIMNPLNSVSTLDLEKEFFLTKIINKDASRIRGGFGCFK